jgi:hypothetical protein
MKTKCVIYGKGLKVNQLQKMIKNGYSSKKDKKIDGYDLDQELSGKRVQMYHNPETNHTVVAHRGTQGINDWMTDFRLALGDKSSKRFQHSKKQQQLAENKYKDADITTIGHSLGAKVAEEANKNKHEQITLNGATTPWDIGKKVPDNQVNIRTTLDPISMFQNLQNNNGKEILIPSTTWNPLTEHSSDVLSRLNPNKEISQ